MTIADIREQIVDNIKNLWDRAQQSALYNNLRERFEILPARTQQLIMMGAAALVVLFFIYLPLSFYFSAVSRINQFEETRALLRELLKTAGMDDISQLARAVSSDQMKAQTEEILAESGLTPEQISGIDPISGDATSSIVPKGVKNVVQQGVAIRLKKLNVTQIQDIGYRLQNMMPQEIKMTSLEVNRTREEKAAYFDVEFNLINFSIPSTMEESTEDEDASAKKPGKAPKPRRARGGG